MVFTPYMDRLIVHLLRHSGLTAASITVVTDLSPLSSATTYRAQLLAIRALLDEGVQVKSLERLHAKVLWTDGDSVTIGSQNFTSYGRGSREATVIDERDVAGTPFVSVLQEWESGAEVVKLALVEQLLELLEQEAKAVKEASDQLHEAFNAVFGAFLLEQEAQQQERDREADLLRRQEAALARMRAVRDASRHRTAQLVAFAQKKFVQRDYWSDGYVTLLADPDADLTTWFASGTRTIVLKRLQYYPVLSVSDGRLAFARIGKTRITYVNRGVRLAKPFAWRGRSIYRTVNLPDPDADGGNIKLELRPFPDASYWQEVDILFDGGAFEVASHRRSGYVPGDAAERHDRFVSEMLGDTNASSALFESVLATFTLKEVGISDHNAANFFQDNYYRLNLSLYGEAPFLMATPLI